MSFAKILAGRYPGHQKLFSCRALSELNPPRARRIAQAMLTLLFSLRDCFRARAVLQAEIFALRHQLLSWSCNVRAVSISSVSVGLTESCGFGSPFCGTTCG